MLCKGPSAEGWRSVDGLVADQAGNRTPRAFGDHFWSLCDTVASESVKPCKSMNGVMVPSIARQASVEACCN